MKLNRMSVVAASVGGLVLVGTAVAAVAMGGDGAETPPQAPAVAEQPVVLESGSTDQSVAPTATATGNAAKESADKSRETQSGQQQKITWEEAVAIAEQALAGQGTVGSVAEVELDYEHGRAVWEVEFTSEHEVYVDASTGKVIKIELDDDHRPGHHGDDFEYDDRHDD